VPGSAWRPGGRLGAESIEGQWMLAAAALVAAIVGTGILT
jgi:hypothetical protein